MMSPTSLYRTPGRTAATAFISASCVTLISRLPSSSTLPTQMVSLRSPWKLREGARGKVREGEGWQGNAGGRWGKPGLSN